MPQSRSTARPKAPKEGEISAVFHILSSYRDLRKVYFVIVAFPEYLQLHFCVTTE